MGGRTHGRRSRRTSAKTAPLRQPDYRNLVHPFQPQSVFSDDETANIHETALRVLEELGIKVLLPEARRNIALEKSVVRCLCKLKMNL